MAQCAYHPDARGSATCPACQKHICDKCRMRGTAERCMTCHSAHAKGGTEGSRLKRPMCANHADVPTDMVCVRCRQPHCPGCLNGAQKCFRCALKPEPGANRGTGPLKGGGTGKLKGGGTGMLRGGNQPFWRSHAFKQVAGGAVVMVGCWFALKAVLPMTGLSIPGFGKKPVVKPYMGTAKVEIVAPRSAQISGNQIIKLKVAGADHIDRVELTVDGKRWERFKKAPFESDWPTQIFKNGGHVVIAKAYYKGGKKVATATRRFTTRNKP